MLLFFRNHFFFITVVLLHILQIILIVFFFLYESRLSIFYLDIVKKAQLFWAIFRYFILVAKI